MEVSSNIHLFGDEDEKVKIQEYDIEGQKKLVLNIGLDVNIFGTEKDFIKIHEALSKALYDEPTYEELENKIYELQAKLEELQDENDYLRELKEERMGF